MAAPGLRGVGLSMAPTGPDALGDTVQYRLPGKSSVYPGSSGAFFLPQIADLLVINNYLDANEPQSEARLSRMHFHDNQRKVDYVLAYHYRKRGAHHGHGSPGHSLAVISNGETGKERHAGGPGDIELGPLDALEEERREQRDEFEHNLMAAGLELEKDLEQGALGLLPTVGYRNESREHQMPIGPFFNKPSMKAPGQRHQAEQLKRCNEAFCEHALDDVANKSYS
ncbi:hypothetical protein ACRRTK_005987 [Alexandromys fortis]